MPLYLDVHTIDGGVSASDVADAHMKDLEVQEKEIARRQTKHGSGP